MAGVFYTDFNQRQEVVPRLLDAAGLASCLFASERNKRVPVLIKPNLVNDSPFPITTPLWIVKEVVSYIRSIDSKREIVIAEGTGQPDTETLALFAHHGYTKISGVDFIDLNNAKCKVIALPEGRKWKKVYIPEVVLDFFVISMPVLKAHTLAQVTLSMKNMIGVCPPKYYQADGFWRKSAFHTQIHEAIVDLNEASAPNFCVLDATVGLCKSHLSGPRCSPAVNKIAASADPVALDALGAFFLGKNWKDIGHIKMANGIIGRVDTPCTKID